MAPDAQTPRAALCLLVAAAIGLAGPGRAEEVYLDRRCNRVEGPGEAFRVDYRRTLPSPEGTLRFSMARFQDGSAIFCLTRPGAARGRLLAEETLQRQFIRDIRQEGERSSFLITVAYGNGRSVPLVQFRLNLNDPSHPELIRLREWRE
ncbi:MAG: hypothetical protein VKI81_06050 [Synechococcaceae cyanobacterium]|nr:hypothetical protein [Synechococcaceae cyanobacterium]